MLAGMMRDACGKDLQAGAPWRLPWLLGPWTACLLLIAACGNGVDDGDSKATAIPLLPSGADDREMAAALARHLPGSQQRVLSEALSLCLDPGTPESTRSVLAVGVATSASLDAAVSFLTRISGEDLFDAYYALGRRAGAAEALGLEYQRRKAEGAGALERRRLLWGMGAKPLLLEPILRGDPAPEVRAQALKTLAAFGSADDVLLLRIQDAWQAGPESPGGIEALDAVHALSSVKRRGSPTVREGALVIMLEIARSEGVALQVRREAVKRLRADLPPEVLPQLPARPPIRTNGG